MTTRKSPDSEPPESHEEISAVADGWVRQFIRDFDWQFLNANRELPMEASIAEFQIATARAIVATFIESGMEFEAVLELFGQVALQWRSVEVTWTDVMNRRRFLLIDKEIQGTLTASERIELSGLTRIMRDEIDTEANLPMEGAKSLHRKLLQMDSEGRSD